MYNQSNRPALLGLMSLPRISTPRSQPQERGIAPGKRQGIDAPLALTSRGDKGGSAEAVAADTAAGRGGEGCAPSTACEKGDNAPTFGTPGDSPAAGSTVDPDPFGVSDMSSSLGNAKYPASNDSDGESYELPPLRGYESFDRLVHGSGHGASDRAFTAERAWTADTPVRRRQRPERGVRSALDSIVTKEENARLKREVADRESRIVALESTFTSYLSEKERASTRSLWLKQYAAQGRFALYNTVLALRVCEAWSNEVADARFLRLEDHIREECRYMTALVRERILNKTIRKRSTALLEVCFAMWIANLGMARSELSVQLAMKSLSGTGNHLAESLMSQFNKQDQNLLIECFSYWVGAAAQLHFHRRLTKARDELAHVAKKSKAEKQRLMQRFRQNALALMSKMAEGSARALRQSAFLAWYRVYDEPRQERMLQAALARSGANNEMARQQTLMMLERSFGVAGKALMGTCFQGWQGALRSKRQKKNGMVATLKGIACNERVLRVRCFTAWAADLKTSRLMKLIESAEAWSGRAAAARKKALAQYERQLAADAQALVRACFAELKKEVKRSKERREKKDSIMARSTRAIAGSDEALKSMLFASWVNSTREGKETTKVRVRMQRWLALSQGMAGKLRDRLLIRQAWNSWVTRAL